MDFLLHFGPSHYNDLFRCEEPYFSSRGKGDVKAFVEKYLENYEKSERKGLICIPSGNHDMNRLAPALTQDEIKIVFAFLLSMPGAPFIYYGDEIGMRYVSNLVSKEGGYGRTGARTPMQWDSSKNAGFSSAKKSQLYIPQDSDPARPTVSQQMKDKNSLWNEVHTLINLRLETSALQNTADIEFINVGYPLVYKRGKGKDWVTVIINPSNKACNVKIPEGELLHVAGNGLEYKNGAYQVKGGTAAFIR